MGHNISLYYRSSLTTMECGIYEAIRSAITRYADCVSVPAIPCENLIRIFELVKLDDPHLFWAKSISVGHTPGGLDITVFFSYSFRKKKEAEAMQASLNKRLERITAPALAMGEREKLRYVHDWICRNVRYMRLEKRYSHEIDGTLQNGIGVCEGIAKTAKVMLDMLSVPTIVVIGEPNDDGIRHAWNVSLMFGHVFPFDITFDLSLSLPEKISYRYFLCDDKIFNLTHRAPYYKIPKEFANDI